MPEDDDGLVPPLKIMRKRLNGVYSAEGFRAPTRRYVLLVALLVALASVPTLAAITAGSNSLEDGTVGAMDAPLLPPPVSPSPLPSASSGSGSAPSSPAGLSPSSPDAGGETAVQGQAGKRLTKPGASRADSGEGSGESDDFRYGHSPSGGSDSPPSPAVPSRPGKPASPGGSNPGDSSGSGPDGSGSEGSGSEGSGSDGSGSDGSGPDWSGFDDWRSGEWRSGEWGSDRSGSDGSVGDDSMGDGSEGDGSGAHGSGADGSEADGSGSDGSGAPAEPEDPDDPGQQPPTRQPWCNDRGECSSRPSHHHRPDWSRHRQCGESPHKARYSHHREGRVRVVLVHIGSSSRHAQPVTIREDAHDQHRLGRTKQLIRSLVSHRSDSAGRSSSRRSEVVERPQNLRLARSPERTHNSHRSQYSADHADGPQASHSYRGSHRAERMHSADDQRSSRVGRHHADQHRDHSGRW